MSTSTVQLIMLTEPLSPGETRYRNLCMASVWGNSQVSEGHAPPHWLLPQQVPVAPKGYSPGCCK